MWTVGSIFQWRFLRDLRLRLERFFLPPAWGAMPMPFGMDELLFERRLVTGVIRAIGWVWFTGALEAEGVLAADPITTK